MSPLTLQYTFTRGVFARLFDPANLISIQASAESLGGSSEADLSELTVSDTETPSPSAQFRQILSSHNTEAIKTFLLTPTHSSIAAVHQNPAAAATLRDVFTQGVTCFEIYADAGSIACRRLPSHSTALAGWPDLLCMSESSTAATRLIEKGTIPKGWIRTTFGMKVLPASDLSVVADAPVLTVATSNNRHLHVCLPNISLRRQLPVMLKLRRWGEALPVWKWLGLAALDAADDDTIIAVLMDDKEPTTPLAQIISDAAAIPRERREKWATQFEATSSMALEFGVVWKSVGLQELEIDGGDDIFITSFDDVELVHGGVEASHVEAAKNAVYALQTALQIERRLTGMLWSTDSNSEGNDSWENDSESEEDEEEYEEDEEDSD